MSIPGPDAVSSMSPPSEAPPAPAAAGARARRSSGIARRIFGAQEFGPALALIVMVAVIGITHPRFFDQQVIISNVLTASFVAMVAYGMVYLLSMAELDISVGGTYAVCFWLAAKWMEPGALNPYLAAAAAVLVGVGLGAVNGVLASLFRAPVLIITLGTFSLYRGFVSVISGGETTQSLPTESSFFTALGGNLLGLPVIGWLTLAVGIVLTFVFTKTRFGVLARATGDNADAAAFSGIPIGRVRLYALMLTGGLAGLSGVLSLAYFQSGDPTVGTGIEIQVIAAAIIGGTAVSGGSGSVPGALLGALIVSVITSGIVFFGVSPLWGNVVTGAVIILAVGSDALLRHRRSRAAVRDL